MVILFKGTDKSKNYAPQALALCAGISATKYLKKTLIVQLTTKYPVEGYMIGKRIADQQINNDMYLFEDSGVDSLTRRAGITSFNADHFANAITPAVSSENLLDILTVSKKVESDVEREIVADPTIVGTIIKSAKKLYDNIFVLANGKADRVVEAVLLYMDKSVTCVSQGLKEDISAPECEKNFYLVTSFDYKSIYSQRQMLREYGANKKIFIMPYNVEFKDAYTDKNMLQYILRNTSPETSDYSYHLITEMSKLCRALIDEEDIEDNEFKFSFRTYERYINEPVLVTGDDIDIETTEKKFLKKPKKHIHYNGPTSNEVLDDIPKKKKHSKKRLELEDEAEESVNTALGKEEQPVKKKKKKRSKKEGTLSIDENGNPYDPINYLTPNNTVGHRVLFSQEEVQEPVQAGTEYTDAVYPDNTYTETPGNNEYSDETVMDAVQEQRMEQAIGANGYGTYMTQEVSYESPMLGENGYGYENIVDPIYYGNPA